MSATDTLGRVIYGFASMFFLTGVLYWINYLTLGGGVSAMRVSVMAFILGTVLAIIAYGIQWV